MTGKKVWVTWMPPREASHQPEEYVRLLGQYGLAVTCHVWMDDLGKMAWPGLGAALQDTTEADLWLIAGAESELMKSSNRYALSLLTAIVRASRGEAFPIVYLGLDFAARPHTMPTLMRPCPFVTATEQSWPAKIVAAAFTPPKVRALDFHLGLHVDPLFGQWFEIGPHQESWAGVMFGVAEGGTITHHAVGTRAKLPTRSVLEYQLRGLQAQVGKIVYTAWSVHNRLSSEDSYFVRVEGFPSSIIVGGHPATDQEEVFVLTLQ